MVAMIESWLGLLSPFWPQLKALGLALLFSWGVTQTLKTGWRAVKGSMQYAPKDAAEKLALRVVATVLCFVPLYQLWPDEHDAIWWALVFSILSPAIYKVVTYLLYSKFPFLEKALSANPPITIRRDKHGIPIGFKEGDDTTVFFDVGTPTTQGNEDTTEPRQDG